MHVLTNAFRRDPLRALEFAIPAAQVSVVVTPGTLKWHLASLPLSCCSGNS